MNGAPSSTWFTTGPHWGWFIALYFFFGGLAGGSYFLAALIDLFGRREDRPLAHIGYYVAFPCVALSGLLLTMDLGKPPRFWHMLIESNTYRPMFKYWSPMSIGSWVLLTFGFFTLASFLGALAEDDRIPWTAFRKLRAPAAPGLVVELLGGISGFYVASYTGVLLGVTNRPIWSDTPLLGMLFVISAASTSAALMTLLAQLTRRAAPAFPGMADLHRMETWVIAIELLVFAAVVVSLGRVLSAWLNGWGLLVLIVVIPGMVAPLFFSSRNSRIRGVNIQTSAILVLIAGFILRVVIVFSSERV
jgi:formate-dependent nitrite reductase membrane component NrfD